MFYNSKDGIGNNKDEISKTMSILSKYLLGNMILLHIR